MKPTDFEDYTERLRASLESVPGVIGLVTLGSTADPVFRDEWSDHDFWVITEPGAQDFLVEDLSWLPDYQNILFAVSHRPHGRTILFRDRHKVELAVFDTSEVSSGKLERYQVLIDRDGIAELIGNIHRETHQQAKLRPEALENLCVLLWSACELYARGEILHARQYLDGFAINQLLNILQSESGDERKDALDPRRRLEMRSPELAAELLESYGKPVPDAALRLLEIVERELKPHAPSLPWEKVKTVHDWISEIRSSRA
jgi:Streptomycin adenylyltransferase